MKPQKIPIYLLTGFLGSGKTTLLKEWLGDPLLKDSALIINELGEVGVDQGLLTSAAETSALVSDACVCCTGLQGLSEALEDLFWARLQKRVHKFPQLIIETTGLAMPGPILDTLASNSLLLERYEWAGTITCVSAKSYKEVMLQFQEAQAQLTKADVCILTKTDLISPEQLLAARLELTEFLSHHELSTPLLNSKQASLKAPEMLEALRTKGVKKAPTTPHASSSSAQVLSRNGTGENQEGHQEQHQAAHAKEGAGEGDGQCHHQDDHHHGEHEHHHHLHAQTFFWRMPEQRPLRFRETQVLELKALLGHHLLRLKGWVLCDEGVQLLQMSPFDTALQVQRQDQAPLQSSASSELGMPWGLTLIVKDQLPQEVTEVMRSLVFGQPFAQGD